MDTNTAARIRSTGILKTLQDGLAAGRISRSEFDEHQALARQLVEMIEADAEKQAGTNANSGKTVLSEHRTGRSAAPE